MTRKALRISAVVVLAACGGAARAPSNGAPPPGSPVAPFTPDRTPPETTIRSGPAGTVDTRAAAFGFRCDEAECAFSCRLDGGAWTACESPRGYADLADGEHVFAVRAADVAGNVDPSPATRTWTIDTAAPPAAPYAVALAFTRLPRGGVDPFRVTVTLTQGGAPRPGRTLTIFVPRGAASPVTDAGDGTYAFVVTPATTGIYPVAVTYAGASMRRDALVLGAVADGVGQPLVVPGAVNSPGYEDGITVTPDGEYLFIQYGPFHFTGLFDLTTICQEAGWALYDLTTCPGKTDGDLVFETIGPYADATRPLFPVGAISDGMLTHLPVTVPTIANGIALFPTVFYGFHRQADGAFAAPFKVAFDDALGANGPYGLSFQMLDATHARFLMAWNDYFDDRGDDKPDVYHGVVTMDVTNNLGDVTYAGPYFASITPHVAPVGFASHAGVQGNPHLYYDAGGVVRSIWTDDEQVSHDLTIYRLTSGAFPDGAWTPVTAAAKINTAASESQPFFTGTHLLLNRDVAIVAHAYLGAGGADYDQDAAWGDAVTLLAGGDTALGGIFGVGEPTVAVRDGKTYLYFVYVETRAIRPSGRRDYDMGAAFVEIPAAYGP